MRLRICEILVAIVMLISGTGKMMNASGFGELISSYGLEWFSIFSPLIILLELLIGLCLLFRLHTRFFAMICMAMIAIFTIAFLYANVFHGIEDCGCFGDIGTSMPSWLTYLRNGVLLVLCWLIIKYGIAGKQKEMLPKWYVVAALMLVCTFWTGHTWQLSSFYANKLARPHELIDLKVAETVLNKYVPVSNDSTYVVWVFSHSCGSCANGIENIKHYQHGVADRLVPLCVTEPTEQKNKLLGIDFETKYVGDGLLDFIKVLPTLLYIKDGRIRFVIEGSVPNVYLFKRNYLEKTNEEILNETTHLLKTD